MSGPLSQGTTTRDWIRILRLRESPRLLGFGLGLVGPDPRITGNRWIRTLGSVGNRGIRTLESQVIVGSGPVIVSNRWIRY
jgi:hypothetical protein